MSSPAGWYPQPDGQQRYWDGELWTEHFAPGTSAVTKPLPVLEPQQVTASSARKFGRADFIGWGGLALFVLISTLGSGFSGFAMSLGLFGLVVAVIAMARGRVGWARLGSRAAGGVALGAALVLLTVGALAAPTPNTSPTVEAAVASKTAQAAKEAADADAAIKEAQADGLKAAELEATKDAAAAAAPKIDPVAAAVEKAEPGTALAAVAALTVKGRAPKTGYSRSQFGQAWFDADRNGCDTRNDMLRRDLETRQMKNACKVLAGTLAPDPYTAKSIQFIYGGASELDIDHVVALSDAWQKGAARWQSGKRLAFANDPLNLLAVDSSANRSKGDGDAATWLPSNKSYRCTYVAKQVAVKGKYGVWVTAAERDAMNRVLATCPTMGLPGPGSAPIVAVLPKPKPKPAPAPARVAPAPVKRAPAPAPAPDPVQQPPASDVYYQNCTAVRAAGAAPIYPGDPGFQSKFDRDKDGIGCD